MKSKSSLSIEKNLFFFLFCKNLSAPNNKTMATRKMRISFLSVWNTFVVQMHSYTMFSWGIIWIEWNGNTQEWGIQRIENFLKNQFH